jgi:hypothetical protein
MPPIFSNNYTHTHNIIKILYIVNKSVLQNSFSAVRYSLLLPLILYSYNIYFRPEDSDHTIVFDNPLYCEPELASSLNDDALKNIHDVTDTEQLIDSS